MPVICICLSPGFQRSVIIDSLIAGEVNRLKSVNVDVAGKGVNVCRVLQRLGVEACCLAQGGSNADELMSLARLEGLDLRLIPSSGQLRTCTSIVETSMATGRRVTELVEPSSPVDESCVDTLTQMVQAMLPSATALVLAGSMAPGYPAGYLTRLASMARESGVPVLLDVQGSVLIDTIVARPAVVKINLAEFAATFFARRFSGGEHGGDLAEPLVSADIINAVAEVSRNHETSFVLTRGAESILLARDGDVRCIPVPALAAEQIINPIGSGDAFLAGMLAQLLTSWCNPDWDNIPLEALEKAIGLATACAQSNARTLRPGLLEASFMASLKPC
jgi:fructose-1-phosphate kinase PfkB-like protein